MSAKLPPSSWAPKMVREIRAEAGMSRRALAEAAGLHPGVIQRMEDGSACTLPALERVLGAMGYELEIVKCR